MRFAFLCSALLLSWPAAAEVVPLPGASGQHAIVGQLFPNPIGVRVTTAGGNPAPNATVNWSFSVFGPDVGRGRGVPTGRLDGPIRSAPGCVEQAGEIRCSTTADGDGVAVFPGAFGTVAGTYSIHVISRFGDEFGFTGIQLIADPRLTPFTIDVLSGESMSIVAPGDAQPLRVQLTRADGSRAAGVDVLFVVDSTYASFVYPYPGSQLVNYLEVRTDADGVATTPLLRAAFAFGAYEIYIRAYDAPAAAYVQRYLPARNISADGSADVSVQGMWWGGPSQNGWGLSLMQHGRSFFGVLFAYDAAGQPTWYVMPVGRWEGVTGRLLGGILYTARGAPYFDYDATKLVLSNPYHNYNRFNLDMPYDIDRMGMYFPGPAQAQFDTTLFERAPISRVISNLVPQDFSGDAPSPIAGLADMWWGGPAQNGWGVAIHEQPGALFSVWLTYDATGAPTWFFMPGGMWVDSMTYAGDVFRASGSPLGQDGKPYNASILQVARVGTYRFVFTDKNNATMHYDVEGHVGTNALTRQDF